MGWVAELADRLDGLDTGGPPPAVVLHSRCPGGRLRAAASGRTFREAIYEAFAIWSRQGVALPGCHFQVEAIAGLRGAISFAELVEVFRSKPGRPYLYALLLPGAVMTPVDFATTPVEAPGAREEIRMTLRRLGFEGDLPGDATRVLICDVHAYHVQLPRQEDERVRIEYSRYHRQRRQRTDREAIEAAIGLAADWLLQPRDGELDCFPYSYDPRLDRFDDSDYNLLRHAGVVWSLLQAYEVTGRPEILARADRGLSFLDRFSARERSDAGVRIYLIEPESQKAKLGGAALWLLALAERARLAGVGLAGETMQGLARHVRLAQDASSGRFESLHRGPGLSWDDWSSAYYPPEALFALHRAAPFLEEDFPLCSVSRKGLVYLLGDKGHEESEPARGYRYVNQWLVYAVLAYRRDCADEDFDWYLHRELAQLEKTTAPGSVHPVMAGAFLEDPFSLSTNPTRLEALSAICADLGAEDAAVEEICSELLPVAVGMQLGFQYSGENAWLWPAPARASGGFAHGLEDPVVRMDIVQHHLSALFSALPCLHRMDAGPDPAAFGRWVRVQLANRKWRALPETDRPLRREELESALHLARRYMHGQQRADGSFVYAYDLEAARALDERHPVREAGALWSLSRLLAWRRDPESVESVRRGLARYLKHSAAGPAPGTQVIRLPGDEYLRTGTLALVTLAGLDALGSQAWPAAEREQLLATLRAYVRMLWWLQREDLHFAGAYHHASRLACQRSSPYADGESLLALVKACRLLGCSAERQRLERTALRLARDYTQRAWAAHADSLRCKGFFQWGSMAFAEWDRGRHAPALHATALLLAWWQLHVHRILERPRNTAYAFEGLACALGLAREQGLDAAERELRAAVHSGFGKLLAWQIGGPRDEGRGWRRDPRAVGGVLAGEGDSALRIDTVQHQAHATWLILQALFGGQR
ncbi:MAG: hypothetical protein JXR96_15735 [Deltaproteobacteria bacterium]|nr:hypothetical protein [Deltaproteobacteria bacterium]